MDKWGGVIFDLKALRRAFEAFDIDGSGTVEINELLEVCRLLGVTGFSAADLTAKFKKADINESGGITFDEFVHFFKSLRQHLSCDEEQAWEILNQRPHERTSDDVARLRNYLFGSQPFFQQFSRDMVTQVITCKTVSAFSWLWKQGEVADQAAVILQGSVSVWTKSGAPLKQSIATAVAASSAAPSRSSSSKAMRQLLETDRIDLDLDQELERDDDDLSFSRTTSVSLRTALTSMRIRSSQNDRLMSPSDSTSGLRSSMNTPWKDLAKQVRSGGGAYSDTLEKSSETLAQDQDALLVSSGVHQLQTSRSKISRMPSSMKPRVNASTSEALSSSKLTTSRSGPSVKLPQSNGHLFPPSNSVGHGTPCTDEIPKGLCKVNSSSSRGVIVLAPSFRVSQGLEDSNLEDRNALLEPIVGVRLGLKSPQCSPPVSPSNPKRSMHVKGTQGHDGLRDQEINLHSNAINQPKFKPHSRLKREGAAAAAAAVEIVPQEQPQQRADTELSPWELEGEFSELRFQDDGKNNVDSSYKSKGGLSHHEDHVQSCGGVTDPPEKFNECQGLCEKILPQLIQLEEEQGQKTVNEAIKSPPTRNDSNCATGLNIIFPPEGSSSAPQSGLVVSDLNAYSKAQATVEGIVNMLVPGHTHGVYTILQENTGYLSGQLSAGTVQNDHVQPSINDSMKINLGVSIPPDFICNLEPMHPDHDNLSQDPSTPRPTWVATSPASLDSRAMASSNPNVFKNIEKGPTAQRRDSPSQSFVFESTQGLVLNSSVNYTLQNDLNSNSSSVQLTGQFRPAAKAIRFANAVKEAAASAVVDLAARKARGPVQGDESVRQRAVLAGEASALSLDYDLMMRSWSDQLDAQAQNAGGTSKVLPRSQQDAFLGFVHASGILGEALLVPAESAPAAAAVSATAAGRTVDLHRGATDLMQSPELQVPDSHCTSALAVSPLRLLIIERNDFLKALKLCKGKPIYSADYLLKLAGKPYSARSGPEAATLVHYLGSLPSFEDTPISLRLQLSHSLKPRRIEEGCLLMTSGTYADSIYLVVDGTLGVLRHQERNGSEAILGRTVSVAFDDMTMDGSMAKGQYARRSSGYTGERRSSGILDNHPYNETALAQGNEAAFAGMTAQLRGKHMKSAMRPAAVTSVDPSTHKGTVVSPKDTEPQISDFASKRPTSPLPPTSPCRSPLPSCPSSPMHVHSPGIPPVSPSPRPYENAAHWAPSTSPSPLNSSRRMRIVGKNSRSSSRRGSRDDHGHPTQPQHPEMWKQLRLSMNPRRPGVAAAASTIEPALDPSCSGDRSITSAHVRSALMLANVLEGRDFMTGLESVARPQDESLGGLVQQIGPGKAVGEMQLLESMDALEMNHPLEPLTINVVALHPSAVLCISANAYQDSLRAYRSAQYTEILRFLKGISVCRSVQHQNLAMISQALTWLDVQRGTVLIDHGAPLQGVYFVREGQLAVLGPVHHKRVSEDPPIPKGSHPLQKLALLGPNDHFGDDALLSKAKGTHQFTVVAESPCKLGWLRPSDMMLLNRAAISDLISNAIIRASYRDSRGLSSENDSGINAVINPGSKKTGASRTKFKSMETVPHSSKFELLERWLGPLSKVAPGLDRSKVSSDSVSNVIRLDQNHSQDGQAAHVQHDPKKQESLEQLDKSDEIILNELLNELLEEQAQDSNVQFRERSEQQEQQQQVSRPGESAPDDHVMQPEGLQLMQQDAGQMELWAKQMLEQKQNFRKQEKQILKSTGKFCYKGWHAPSNPISASDVSGHGLIRHNTSQQRRSNPMAFPASSISVAETFQPDISARTIAQQQVNRKATKQISKQRSAHDHALQGFIQATLPMVDQRPPSLCSSLHGQTTDETGEASTAPRYPDRSDQALNPMCPISPVTMHMGAAKYQPESALLMARSQAGLPIRPSLTTPISGSLSVGMHYSGADVTSFRWKELQERAPSQSSFINRVDMLKISLVNNFEPFGVNQPPWPGVHNQFK